MDELPNIKCPDMPKWLKAAETAVIKNKRENVTEELMSLLSLYRGAIDRNPISAGLLAERFETGEVPGLINVMDAIKWYEWAAHLGHSGSKVKVAQLYFWHSQNESMIAKAKLHAKEYLAFVIMAKHPNEKDIHRAGIVCKLLLDSEPDDESMELVEEVLKLKGFDKHPDAKNLQQKIDKCNCQSGKLHLSLQVVSRKISDEGDFRAGIYKCLENPLPLIKLPNPELVKSALDQEFPWFANINSVIYQQLLIQQYNVKPAFRIRPLLIAGDSGLGKTTWAHRVAELCSVTFRTIMAGGSSDSMLLKGLARGWSSARPSLVLQTIATESITNPIFLLDEIDKASPDAKNGRIWDVLLGLLEPANSKNFFDECLSMPCDLSWVSWIATANAIGPLPKPLLERFHIVVVKAPGPEHFMTLVHGARKAFASELGIDSRMLPDLTQQDIEVIRQSTSPRKINLTTRYFIEKHMVNESQNAMRN